MIHIGAQLMLKARLSADKLITMCACTDHSVSTTYFHCGSAIDRERTWS